MSLVRRRHEAGLGGTMVASASTAVVGAVTITIVTITITIVAIVATIVAITIVTVASTASAGGILVGTTSLLARTIVGSFGRTLAARLVLLELGESAVAYVGSVILHERRTEGGDVLVEFVVRLGVLLLVRPREGEEDGLGELVRRRARELRTEKAAVEVGQDGRSAAEAHFRCHRHRLFRHARHDAGRPADRHARWLAGAADGRGVDHRRLGVHGRTPPDRLHALRRTDRLRVLRQTGNLRSSGKAFSSGVRMTIEKYFY